MWSRGDTATTAPKRCSSPGHRVRVPCPLLVTGQQYGGNYTDAAVYGPNPQVHFHITVTVHIKGGCSPLTVEYHDSTTWRAPSQLAQLSPNSLYKLLSKALPSSSCHHHRRHWGHGHSRKAGATATNPKPQWLSHSVPHATTGKTEVGTAARVPCHNLGGAGRVAEVVPQLPGGKVRLESLSKRFQTN